MTRKLTCHCGAVELRVTLKYGLDAVHRCNCSFCARRGAIATPVAYPEGLEIVKGADNLTLYQWNTKAAEHYFCKTCGIYTHHRRRSNPNEFSINVSALEGVNPAELGEIEWLDGINHSKDQ
jgi:hypothetical protein